MVQQFRKKAEKRKALYEKVKDKMRAVLKCVTGLQQARRFDTKVSALFLY